MTDSDLVLILAASNVLISVIATQLTGRAVRNYAGSFKRVLRLNAIILAFCLLPSLGWVLFGDVISFMLALLACPALLLAAITVNLVKIGIIKSQASEKPSSTEPA